MSADTNTTIKVLAEHGIHPQEGDYGEFELPEVRDIEENETVYTTSLDELFPEEKYLEEASIPIDSDRRFEDFSNEIYELVKQGKRDPKKKRLLSPKDAPKEFGAWYCPVHFYGPGWGIYIREEHVLWYANYIAQFVDWRAVKLPQDEISRQLLRASFYLFFLHEQFHHKVESLTFRLLVSTGRDIYRPYKRDVYVPAYLTPNCLEESLANADSYRRLSETRYRRRLDPEIRKGLRECMKNIMAQQPPGYRQGLDYLGDKPFREGLQRLQSQVLDARLNPRTSPEYWEIAPNMVTALSNIEAEIYVVLPAGARPLFHPASVSPGYTASTREIETALTKHFGYQKTRDGGKGSHVKLTKPGARPIILPGNRKVVSPGVTKEILDSLGGYPLSSLPDMLNGRL